MTVFEYGDYRTFLTVKIRSLPKRGRGELKKIADALGMHSTAISQVVKGARDFTYEQACQLCEYLGLTPRETDYFLALLLLERSGTVKMKAVIQRQLREMRERALELTNRVPVDRKLSDSDRAIFYSNWYYSAIRILTSIPGYHSTDAISARLGLSKARVAEALEFLLQSGLCLEINGQIQIGPKHTHLEARSPLIARHHANWRLKAIESFEKLSPNAELAYSGLMSLSKKDALSIRAATVEFVESTLKTVASSPSERLYCLNLDWIEVK